MKKDVEYYMSLPYEIRILPEADGSGFAATVPELPGCITCAQTRGELMDMVDDAMRAWLEAAIEDGYNIKEPLEDYSGQIKIRAPRDLHRRLVQKAHDEGVSMNQYCIYALTKAVL